MPPPPRLAIAAPILARDPDEAARLRAAAALLGNTGFPVFLVDGGSDPAFVADVRALPGVTVEAVRGRGLQAQVRQALARAGGAGAEHILYTEPDKAWFFAHRLAGFLAAHDAGHEGDGVFVAARDAASFATFPRVQQLPESLLNRLCDENLGTPGDVCYGPLVLHRALVPDLDRIDGDLGWGWRIFLLAVARRRGLAVRLWDADLPCPPEQRGEDDERSRDYRLRQLAQNVAGLAQGLCCPLPQPAAAPP